MPPGKKKNKVPEEGARGKPPSKLYTMVIYLMGGPISDEFEGQIISRTIQIRGEQTLEDLHEAIFRAFDRFDEHLYEFLLGASLNDRSAVYSLVDIEFPGLEEDMAGDVRTTIIGSLGPEVGRTFWYRFDFGDEWMHRIDVTAIDDYSGKGKYPKIKRKVGKSPPQYPDPEDE